MSKVMRTYLTKLLARLEMRKGEPYWSATKTTPARPMAQPFCNCHPFELLTDSVAYVLESGDMEGIVVLGLTPKAKKEQHLIKECNL